MLKRMLARRAHRRGTFLAAGLFLVNCQGTVTTDLATEAPADPDVAQVVVSLLGLEYRKSDGTTETLEFSTSESVDLVDYSGGDPLRLFTDEQLPAGIYSGVRLLFDDEDADATFVLDGVGRDFPLAVVNGDYATIDFTVEEEETNREAVTLTLDLRQSLSFDDAQNDFTLTPVLRSVVTEDAADIGGTVSVSCPLGSSLSTGAVYLFQGADVVPDDRDGSGVEPYATAPVTGSGLGTFSYALRYLPAGDYTLALTCEGDEENPSTDDDLDFRNARNVSIDDGESLEQNLP